MLLIPVKLGTSSVHGVGVLSVNSVAKGTPVFAFNPSFDRVYSDTMLRSLSKDVQAKLYHYIWKFKGTPFQYGNYGDEAKYINHKDAKEANLGCVSLKGSASYSASAARDIFAGEELFWDYKQFDDIDISPNNVFEFIRQRTGIEPDAYDDWIEGRIQSLQKL